MKKYLLVCFVLIAGLTAAAAQETGTPDPALIGVDTAQQMLQEISLSKFEDAGMWEASMPHDFGIAQVRKFLGQPQEKTPIEAEVQANINEADDYVLGVKTLYFRRALEYLTITPSRPIPIEGICKTISLWVIGRNYEHTLKILLRDLWKLCRTNHRKTQLFRLETADRGNPPHLGAEGPPLHQQYGNPN